MLRLDQRICSKMGVGCSRGGVVRGFVRRLGKQGKGGISFFVFRGHLYYMTGFATMNHMSLSSA